MVARGGDGADLRGGAVGARGSHVHRGEIDGIELVRRRHHAAVVVRAVEDIVVPRGSQVGGTGGRAKDRDQAPAPRGTLWANPNPLEPHDGSERITFTYEDGKRKIKGREKAGG